MAPASARNQPTPIWLAAGERVTTEATTAVGAMLAVVAGGILASVTDWVDAVAQVAPESIDPTVEFEEPVRRVYIY